MHASARFPGRHTDRPENVESPFSPRPTLAAAVRARRTEWRHTWWFRHAHHPLCTRYAVDVVRLGRLRICRGCAAVYASALVALPPFILAALPARTSWRLEVLAVAAVIATLSVPAVYARLPRLGKDLVRAGLGLLIASWIASLVAGDPLLALATAPPLIILHRIYGRLRGRQESHTRCLSCPEFREGSICSGFVEQAEAHRALEELWSTEAMAAAERRAVLPIATEDEESAR